MNDTLVFGGRTAVLLVTFVQLILLGYARAWQIRNRVANRTLAALLVVLAGMITPWMIGFAGFYDRWQWLSFAPFAISLAIAPLVWLYLYALVHGRLPARPCLHLIPPAVQFGICLVRSCCCASRSRTTGSFNPRPSTAL